MDRRQLAEQLKAPREELPDRVSALVSRLKTVERESAKLREQLLTAEAAGHAANAVDVNGVAYVGLVAPADVTAGDLRGFARSIVDKVGDGRPAVAAVLTAPVNGNSSLVVFANPAARDRGHSAGQLVKHALSGRGGGSDEVAQGGGDVQPERVLGAVPEALANTN